MHKICMDALFEEKIFSRELYLQSSAAFGDLHLEQKSFLAFCTPYQDLCNTAVPKGWLPTYWNWSLRDHKSCGPPLQAVFIGKGQQSAGRKVRNAISKHCQKALVPALNYCTFSELWHGQGHCCTCSLCTEGLKMCNTKQQLPPTTNTFLSLGSCKSNKFGSPEPCPPFFGTESAWSIQQNSVLLLKSIKPALTCWRTSFTFQTKKRDYPMADTLQSWDAPDSLLTTNCDLQGPPSLQAGYDWGEIQHRLCQLTDAALWAWKSSPCGQQSHQQPQFVPAFLTGKSWCLWVEISHQLA